MCFVLYLVAYKNIDFLHHARLAWTTDIEANFVHGQTQVDQLNHSVKSNEYKLQQM